jgi:hypothetical protein
MWNDVPISDHIRKYVSVGDHMWNDVSVSDHIEKYMPISDGI